MRAYGFIVLFKPHDETPEVDTPQALARGAMSRQAATTAMPKKRGGKRKNDGARWTRAPLGL
jgi:hypothetical protein